MNIAIVGTGYVGLVSGTCFAEMGINVTCIDVNKEKINNLLQGNIPIYEPGLDEMVIRNHREGRLNFSTDLASCLNDVEIVFCAVGTPPDENGSADLKYVLEVAHTIGINMNKYVLVVTKSTVPVGTAQKVKAAIKEELDKRKANIDFDVASNPEFLKEGAAIKDFMSPDRVVVGIDSMNDIANLCELVGADVNMVRKGIGADSRIGNKFLYPGCGYGGSCFPKDVKALIKTAELNGYEMKVLKAVEEVNEIQKTILFKKLQKHFNNDLKNKTIAIWGLAFKPETDDMREATSLIMIDLLLEAGCKVKVFDPIAMEECKRRIGNSVEYKQDMYDAVLDANALILLTEWKQFRMPSWGVVKKTMQQAIVIDGRNIYDAKEMEEAGFIYYCIGK